MSEQGIFFSQIYIAKNYKPHLLVQRSRQLPGRRDAERRIRIPHIESALACAL